MPIKPTKSELVQEILPDLLKDPKITQATNQEISFTVRNYRLRLDLDELPRRPNRKDVLKKMGLVP